MGFFGILLKFGIFGNLLTNFWNFLETLKFLGFFGFFLDFPGIFWTDFSSDFPSKKGPGKLTWATFLMNKHGRGRLTYVSPL